MDLCCMCCTKKIRNNPVKNNSQPWGGFKLDPCCLASQVKDNRIWVTELLPQVKAFLFGLVTAPAAQNKWVQEHFRKQLQVWNCSQCVDLSTGKMRDFNPSPQDLLPFPRDYSSLWYFWYSQPTTTWGAMCQAATQTYMSFWLKRTSFEEAPTSNSISSCNGRTHPPAGGKMMGIQHRSNSISLTLW